MFYYVLVFCIFYFCAASYGVTKNDRMNNTVTLTRINSSRCLGQSEPERENIPKVFLNYIARYITMKNRIMRYCIDFDIWEFGM